MQTVNTLCQNTSKECPAVYGPPILKYVTLIFTRVEKELIFWCYSDILYPFIGRWHCM